MEQTFEEKKADLDRQIDDLYEKIHDMERERPRLDDAVLIPRLTVYLEAIAKLIKEKEELIFQNLDLSDEEEETVKLALQTQFPM